jgi:hypothetical protein
MNSRFGAVWTRAKPPGFRTRWNSRSAGTVCGGSRCSITSENWILSNVLSGHGRSVTLPTRISASG